MNDDNPDALDNVTTVPFNVSEIVNSLPSTSVLM